MTIYFTSDWHFGHRMVATETRPFQTVEEHDQAIMDGLNNTLKPGDILYFLGDFMLGSSRADVEKAVAMRKRIACKQIFLIWGNHDHWLRGKTEFTRWFVKCADLHEVTHDGQSIILCHYAMRIWNRRHYGSWHLYGHSHGSLPDDPGSCSFDAGVDCWGFKPISWDQVAAKMSSKTSAIIDHHTKEIG